MKIITINVPESYVIAIEKLCGNNKMYPSRSELIRVAVREFVIAKAKLVKDFEKLANNQSTIKIATKDDEISGDVINIPFNRVDLSNESTVAYKTYKRVGK